MIIPAPGRGSRGPAPVAPPRGTTPSYPARRLTAGQRLLLAGLVRSFAALLTPHTDNGGILQQWITAVHAANLPCLHAFTRGLDLGIRAATATLTLPHHNGRTEGVNT